MTYMQDMDEAKRWLSRKADSVKDAEAAISRLLFLAVSAVATHEVSPDTNPILGRPWAALDDFTTRARSKSVLDGNIDHAGEALIDVAACIYQDFLAAVVRQGACYAD